MAASRHGNEPRHVLVAVRTYAAYGQRIVDGILDFAEPLARWEFRPIRGSEALSPEAIAGMDGAIVEIRNDEQRREVESWRVPAVAVTGVHHPGSVPTVVADNHAVGAMAAEYFLSLGFDHVGYMGVSDMLYITQRREGLAAGLEDADARLHVFDIEQWRDGDRDPLHGWLKSVPKPIAILAAEDSSAVWVANACRDVGIPVPEQVAILGVDNDERLCRMASPPLSSIDHGARRIGAAAAELLDGLMSGEAPPDEAVLIDPTEIVVRQSTDTLAIRDPKVVEAVRYIRRNACDGIGVPEVVGHLHIARRTLEAAFRRTLNRTVLGEINRVRLSRARELLINTDLPMPDICERSGFSYPSRLTYVIKQETGMTPSEFRKKFR